MLYLTNLTLLICLILISVGCGLTKEQPKNSNDFTAKTTNLKIPLKIETKEQLKNSNDFRAKTANLKIPLIIEKDLDMIAAESKLDAAKNSGKIIQYPTLIDYKKPIYPTEMLKNSEEAAIFCRILISSKGIALKVKCYEYPNLPVSNEFILVSEESLATAKFNPGSINGVATDFVVHMPFRFKLTL
jgi:hypothetical protein